jgi:putative NADH-flavin reductase
VKILVIGASGRVGREVLAQAVAAGHQVTAAVRDPAGVAAVPGVAAATVAVADVLDPAALTPLVTGQDAVISTLGPRDRRPTTLCSDGARSTVTAMRAAGVRRLLVVSVSGGYIEPADGWLTRRVAKPLVGSILRHNFADADAMETEVRGSGLDWTVVRPPRLTNGPATGTYRTGTAGVRRGYTIARADLAAALLRFATNPATIGGTITVAQ